MRSRGVLGVVLAAALLAAPAADARSPKLEVLTGRADLVSGGQALVGVHLPSGADADELRVRANGRDVTSRFRADGADLVKGLVLRLRDGRNVVVASLEGEGSARLRITNHPTGGPMFGGPQTQPWKCQEKAVDKQCNQRAEYSWLYRSTDPTATGLQSFDLENPPSDVATTTTDQGVEVPFVVRDETGYIDRDQYRILVLADPAQKKWSRWSPQPTWNHKVLSPGGGGCGSAYGTSYAPLADFAGTIPSIPGRTDSYVDALGRGFAVMSSALANTGHNCNVVTEAEALMMVKERLTERYGDIRYTIGTGCSGGSVVQHTVSNAYPGAVYDGLIVTCSYPDVLTAGGQFADYHLLRQYFENPARWGPGVVWTPQQFAAVEGHLSHVNAVVADEALFKSATNPIGDCAGEDSYNPQSNPGGVRCSILDFMVNVLGPRPPEVWTEQEKAAGHGFAGVPLDNTGIQYGLGALQSGQITAGAVRRPQREGRRVRHRSKSISQSARGRSHCRRQRVSQRPGQRGRPPRRGCDHRPRGPGPGDRTRLRARDLDARPARSVPGQPRQPGAVGRIVALDRGPDLAGRGAGLHGPLARRGRGGRLGQAACPQDRR